MAHLGRSRVTTVLGRQLRILEIKREIEGDMFSINKGNVTLTMHKFVM